MRGASASSSGVKAEKKEHVLRNNYCCCMIRAHKQKTEQEHPKSTTGGKETTATLHQRASRRPKGSTPPPSKRVRAYYVRNTKASDGVSCHHSPEVWLPTPKNDSTLFPSALSPKRKSTVGGKDGPPLATPCSRRATRANPTHSNVNNFYVDQLMLTRLRSSSERADLRLLSPRLSPGLWVGGTSRLLVMIL